MLTQRLVFAIGLGALLLGSHPAAAGSTGDLENEIARLQEEIRQARQRVDPLAAPWIRNKHLTLEIAGTLLTAAIADLDRLNVTRADLKVIDHKGQLWGWEAECRYWDPFCNFPHGCWRVYGREGAYIEFDDPNYRFLARAALTNLRGTWLPGRGLRVDLHAALHAEVGMLKGNRYPCIGGGVGARGGPASGDASADVGAITSLGGLGEQGIRYSLALGVENIRYGLSVNMGSLPDLRLDGTFPGVRANLDGQLGIPLALDGEIVVPLPGGLRPVGYHLDLLQPSVLATGRGIQADSNFLLRWK